MMMTRMAKLLLLTVFIMVKCTVTQPVITVDNVSVKEGKSIIIPCLYGAKFIDDKKYLCVGNIWTFCKDVQKINQRTTISDDKAQHILTVTMKNVTSTDTARYWCSVEILGNDVNKMFQLKVTKATPVLYVDNQMVTGYEGGHVVIFCHHQMMNQKEWCKLGGTCVSTVGNMSGALVQLTSMAGGFSVTMSKLTMDHTGWYWCSGGDNQMPVHITVKTPANSWERRSLAWLVVLGLLLALACIAVIAIWQKKKQCETFPLRKRSENTYTNQHENEQSEAQEYETMSSPVTLEVEGRSSEGNESSKKDGGHHTQKCGFGLKEPYCTFLKPFASNEKL
ncbi:uncharacterized protein si:ch1073-59l16.1 isoform X2 [Silurus meridionalis]|uniref:uncharacterized protein si:ch1073-59l16.1 isoform X2 n=1 Tax=Silurus meridionalis TaxID=175797 RepID=UPI001EECC174|nr:uncharacterized protein si:ch1073-59l16.1 isoform X2 [Silurus meridionalis]